MAQLFGLARIGRDAEVRFIPSGEAVAGLSLAFSYGRKDQAGKKPTQWVDGALWGKRAEAMAPYLKKGGLVVVTLEDVHIETFKKQDGSESSKLAGKISAIEFAGGNDRQAQPAARPAPPTPARQAAPRQASSGFDDMDEDIPF